MALVTGASAGIGEAFARLLAAQGADLFLVARREERLQKLARELSAQYGVRAELYAADLARPEAPAAIVAEAERLGCQIDVLVNNAGFAAGKTFADSEWSALHAEIQVMITAVTELSHRLAPGMKSRHYGRIINLASIASFLPAVASLLYTGVKAFVLNMSEALDMELKPHGIHVTALCPGLTRSEFHDVQGTRWIMDKVPGFMWQDADQVAREGLEAVMAGRPVCVPGAINKAITFTSRLLPERLRYEAGRVAQVVK
jgi:short-subunit dehydrogenase